MICTVRPPNPTFQKGDPVALAHGTYQGTTGEFLRLREDPNWADIAESKGCIRAHPVEWLAAHSKIGLTWARELAAEA